MFDLLCFCAVVVAVVAAAVVSVCYCRLLFVVVMFSFVLDQFVFLMAFGENESCPP